MKYLVDTNVWIVYLKQASTEVRTRLEQTSASDIAVCSIVWAELLHGARKYEKRDVREQKINILLDPFVCLPFDLSAARHYARMRDELERAGQMIGGNDLLIASIAITHGLIVVTHNVGEFGRISGLAVEDWSTPAKPRL